MDGCPGSAVRILAVVAEIAPAGATLQLAAGTYTLERPSGYREARSAWWGRGWIRRLIVFRGGDHVLRSVGAGVFDAEEHHFSP